MNRKEDFIRFIEENIDWDTAPEEILQYWNCCFKEKEEKSKFTKNGILVMKAMKQLNEEVLKAKDIAEVLGVTSRQVVGSLGKLVNDGYVEKLGKSPTYYSLTQAGKDVEIEDEQA